MGKGGGEDGRWIFGRWIFDRWIFDRWSFGRWIFGRVKKIAHWSWVAQVYRLVQRMPEANAPQNF